LLEPSTGRVAKRRLPRLQCEKHHDFGDQLTDPRGSCLVREGKISLPRPKIGTKSSTQSPADARKPSNSRRTRWDGQALLVPHHQRISMPWAGGGSHIPSPHNLPLAYSRLTTHADAGPALQTLTWDWQGPLHNVQEATTLPRGGFPIPRSAPMVVQGGGRTGGDQQRGNIPWPGTRRPLQRNLRRQCD
jgi:hypothetical protein